MELGQIGLQLMDLYGKLRRTSNVQVRHSLEGRIDALVAVYEIEHRAALDRLKLAQAEKDRPRAKR